MPDLAPRSWRSIIFRPGRPPMRRRTALLICAAIFAVVVIVDVSLLTNARILGRIAAIQLRRHGSDVLGFEGVALTLGGQLRLDQFELRRPDPSHPFLTARRVWVSIGLREGGVVAESVILEDPRVRISDLIARNLGGDPGAPARPLREIMSSRYLPRISCRGGTLELGHSLVLAGEQPQVFHIIDLAMVPTTGYRYFVRGALRSAIVGEWGVQGEVDLETGDHRVYLTNEKLVLGPAIRDALKPSIQDAWDKYRPAGPAGVEIFLACDPRNPKGEFRVTLKPLGMGLLYRHFPFACEDVQGEIEFRANGFTVKHIAARNGKTTKIRFDGSADGYEADAGFHFRLEMDDLPLDDVLRKALKEDAQRVWEQFKPSGRLDARAVIHRERGGPEVKESVPVDLHFKDASFSYSGFPYPVEQATGEVRIDGENVVIKRLRAARGKTEITMAGRIDSIAADAEIDLDLRVVKLEADGRLRDAFPPGARDVFDKVSVSGEVDVELRVLKSKGGEPRIRGVARARGENKVLYRDVPLPVVLKEGTVDFNEGRVRFHHLKGRVDPAGEIDVSGEISADGTTAHLEIDGMAVPIDDKFRDRMPKQVGEVLRSLKLSGVADFKFTFDERRERDKPATRVRLSLDLRKGSIASDVSVEDIDGTVVIVGPIREGRPMLSGRIDVRSARIVKKLVRNLRTNITIQGSMLDFRDIGADVYGGKLGGWFSYDTVTNDIEGDFTISKLDLREFVNDTAKWSGKTISGKVDVRIPGLKGKTNDLDSLTSSGGSLAITEGQLLDVPGIINFLNPLESTGKFTAMKAYFDIRRSKFDIKEFAFLGEEGSGSIVGKGWFNFEGQFSLRIRTETASLLGLKFFLFDLPGKLFDILKSPLKVKVEGNLDDSKLFDE
ncbi:MAG TPA: hypothetical protein VFC86_08435 [Planctomycetota bacterium]|nr:hypothetical protein [Planctomycetota bacterium]